MRLTVLSYIGNEQDVIEAFIRHAAGFADRIVTVLTATDRTEEILHLLAAEGLPVDIRRTDAIHHAQHEALSPLLREFADRTDWFLPLDADEFPLGDVRRALEAADAVPWTIPWRTYVPAPGDDPAEPDILRRITHRRATESPAFSKIVIPAGTARTARGLALGNHELIGEDGRLMAGPALPGVALGHFPVRSSDQFLHKIRSGWSRMLRNPDRVPGQAGHWEELFVRYGERDSLDAEELSSIARRYAFAGDEAALVHDPVPHTFTLRYTA